MDRKWGCKRASGQNRLSGLRFQNLCLPLGARFTFLLWRRMQQVSQKLPYISTKPHGITCYNDLTQIRSCLQMDNAGFEKDRRSTVEMGEVSSSSPAVSAATVNGNGVPGCTDVCLALHEQHQKNLQQYQKSTEPRPPDSPWHNLKTVFLVTTVASLVLWVLIYTVLSQLAVVWSSYQTQVQKSSS